jgi:hypothetical protein
MIYECQFPYCTYKTKNRSEIEEHHIIPRCHNGDDRPSNKIYLCPNHHSKIYVPDMTTGIHTTNGKDNIQIMGYVMSTKGRLLEYKTYDNITHFYLIEDVNYENK